MAPVEIVHEQFDHNFWKRGKEAGGCPVAEVCTLHNQSTVKLNTPVAECWYIMKF
jgi:hypothetical protein